MVRPGQARQVTDLARLVTDPPERITPLVLTLQTWPIKPILASIATVVSGRGVSIMSFESNYWVDGRSGTSGAYGTTGTGTTGYGSTGTHHTAGPHSSDLANKADHRVDSDRGKWPKTSGYSLNLIFT